MFPCSRTTYCGGWPACCCCKYCSSANLMPHLVIFFMYLPTHKSKQVSSFEFRVLARNDVTHLLKHISAISLYRRSMSCICSVSISLTSASCPLMLYYFDDGWRREWIGKQNCENATTKFLLLMYQMKRLRYHYVDLQNCIQILVQNNIKKWQHLLSERSPSTLVI